MLCVCLSVFTLCIFLPFFLSLIWYVCLSLTLSVFTFCILSSIAPWLPTQKSFPGDCCVSVLTDGENRLWNHSTLLCHRGHVVVDMSAHVLYKWEIALPWLRTQGQIHFFTFSKKCVCCECFSQDPPNDWRIYFDIGYFIILKDVTVENIMACFKYYMIL